MLALPEASCRRWALMAFVWPAFNLHSEIINLCLLSCSSLKAPAPSHVQCCPVLFERNFSLSLWWLGLGEEWRRPGSFGKMLQNGPAMEAAWTACQAADRRRQPRHTLLEERRRRFPLEHTLPGVLLLSIIIFRHYSFMRMSAPERSAPLVEFDCGAH